MPISRHQTLGFRRSHAFVIGINEYRGLDANLKTAVGDAREIAIRLKVLQGFDNVLLMENAGKGQITALLNWLHPKEGQPRSPELSLPDQDFGHQNTRIAWLKGPEEVAEAQKSTLPALSLSWKKKGNNEGHKEEQAYLVEKSQIDIEPEKDSIAFYYAGHGFPGEKDDEPAGYLAPTDAKSVSHDYFKNDTLIPMWEVYNALKELNCKHTLLILDCCFAGGFRFASLTRGRPKPFLQPMHKARYERYKTRKSWQVLVSAGQDQEANDNAKHKGITGHSPFAQTLIDALEGGADLPTLANRTQGDGVITAQELFLFVWDRVEKLTGDAKPQHPSLFPMADHQGGEFIFLNPNMEPGQFKFAEDPDKNPYKGLVTYEPEDANLFFGRDKAVDSLMRKIPLQEKGAHDSPLEQNAAPEVIFLAAPSAAGKSSLAKAGLFPRLHQEYGYDELLIFRPAVDIQGQSIIPDEKEHKGKYRRESWTGFQSLSARLRGRNKKQVLLVDQFEEYFTEFPSKETQQGFESELLKIIENEAGRREQPLLIIFTLRSDVEWQMPETRLGSKYWTEGHIFRLQPMALEELRQALTGPAWWALYDFKNNLNGQHDDDGENLISQILKDVMYYPAALPLLSCVMQTFYDKAKENNRKQKLAREDYDGFRGVLGALSANAEKFYQDQDEAGKALMQRILLRMINPGDAGYTRRKVTYSETPTHRAETDSGEPQQGERLYELDYGKEGHQQLKTLIDGMEAAHLLVQGKNPEGQPAVEPAHDALINYWPRCLQWLDEFGKETVILQRQLWQAVVESKKQEAISEEGRAKPSGISGALKKAKKARARAEQKRIADKLGGGGTASTPSHFWDTNPRLFQVVAFLFNAGVETLFAAKENPLPQVVLPIEVNLTPEERERFQAALLHWIGEGNIPDLSDQRVYSKSRHASYFQKQERTLLALLEKAGRQPLMVAIRHIKTGLPEQGQANFLYLIEQWLLRGESPNLNAFIINGTSGALLEALLQYGEHWLNKNEADFIRQSWQERIKDIMQLKQERDEAKAIALVATARRLEDHTVALNLVMAAHRLYPNEESRQAVHELSRKAKLWGVDMAGKLRTFDGHWEKILSVDFSPNGAQVLTGSADQTAKLWNVATGGEVRAFQYHSVHSVCFSPDGTHVVTGGADQTARLWETATGKEVKSLKGHSDYVGVVCFSPDGAYVATGSADRTAIVWETATGREVQRFDVGIVSLVRFSPDGAQLLTCSVDQLAKLWNIATGEEVSRFEAYSGGVLSASFSPDGAQVAMQCNTTVILWEAATGREVSRFTPEHYSEYPLLVRFLREVAQVLTCNQDRTIKLWEVATGREVSNFQGHSAGVRSACFSPDGVHLLTGSKDQTAKLWEVATGREVRTFEGHSGGISSVSFSPDGAQALTSSKDQAVKLWEVATGREVRTLKGHSDEVKSVHFSPDGAHALTDSSDKTFKLWEVKAGREVKTFEGAPAEARSVRFSPDGAQVLVGISNKMAQLWEVATGREVRTFQGHLSGITSVSFSPNGAEALTGSDDQMAKLWEVATGREIRAFQGHSGAVSSVCFSPDGKRVLTGSDDQTAKLWEVATGREMRAFQGHSGAVRSVCFSPDGKRVLTGGDDQTAKLWEIATGQEVSSFQGHSGAVHSVCFSPDGKEILTGSADKTAKLWEVEAGREVRTLEGHSAFVLSAAFSPDGSQILTGSADRTAILWGDFYKEWEAGSIWRRLYKLNEEEQKAHRIDWPY